MSSLTTTPFHRNIIELSGSMINNDEAVCYSASKIATKDLRMGKLVISRPVYKEENISDYKFQGEIHNEGVSSLTLILDAYFRIRQDLDLRSTFIENQTPTKFLSHFIAYNYYDCLSGGCSTYVLAILAELCKHPVVDKNEPVYPSDRGSGTGEHDKWYTIADFIDDMNKNVVPRVEQEMNKIKHLLPTSFGAF